MAGTIVLRFVSAHGTRCYTEIVEAPALLRGSRFGSTVTFRSKRRRLILEPSADGLRIRCPGGCVEVYGAAELVAPECTAGGVGEGADEDICQVGSCPAPRRR